MKIFIVRTCGGNSREKQIEVAAKWRNILSFVSRDGGIRTVIDSASAVQGEVLEILLQWCKEKCIFQTVFS